MCVYAITDWGYYLVSYKDSVPPLLRAAAAGDEAACRAELARLGNDAVCTVVDRNGSVAEHWAAGGGHVACVRLLVRTRLALPDAARAPDNAKKGAKRQRRRDGRTAVHWAARNGHANVLRALFEPEFADNFHVDEPTGDGTTPLMLAVSFTTFLFQFFCFSIFLFFSFF